MSTDSYNITVSGLSVEVVRKAIKNLHLGVYPPHGRVRVAVPMTINDDAVRLAVIGKLTWIKRQQAKFEAQPRQSQREMVRGESHYFLGQRYRLHIVEQNGPTRVTLRSTTAMVLTVRPGTTAEQREQIMQSWYRDQLKALIPPLMLKWQETMGVQVASWGIKKMKTKWGSCNIEARRVWINLELVKKPVQCLEYIIVHEMMHMLERHHDDRFTNLMDKFMPQWRLYREELNRFPLKHEQWDY
jgi:hypothetical protein